MEENYENDVVFQLLFGKNENKEILISFLNAILDYSDEEKIIDLKIKEKKLSVNMIIDEKISILDVYVVTNKNTHINVEMQIINEYNMIRRTLFYWSKMYLGQIVKGDNYNSLNKTITINLLDFNYIDEESYHNVYYLMERNTKKQLTDLMEIHFIELQKFKKAVAHKNKKLDRWLKFIINPNDKEVSSMAMIDEDIRKAKEVLLSISADEDSRQLAEMRLKALRDKKSFESAVKRKYKAEGREEGRIEGRAEGRVV